MLESHLKATKLTKLRCKATEQSFEINVYVSRELVERKQQQRRQPDRNNVYDKARKK
ncbi:hypothetical protein WKK05_12295 [Nostoc sp. UHCC 0302]|uniref:hypothetical protein n=1 Tax=Nostoc sp. UHCC 0302 TaxID=3134896 RepID=UPI00311CB9FB